MRSLPRRGERPSGAEAAQTLKHLICRSRSNWPRVEFTARGDGHYGTPEVMELLEDRGCGDVFEISWNAWLRKIGHGFGVEM